MTGEGASPLPLRAIGAVLVLAYAWWVVSLPPFSRSATAAVVLAGAAAGGVGRLTTRPRERRSPVRTVGPWVVLAATGGAWQLAAFLQHPRADHPTLSSLANQLFASHPARGAAFVLWLLGAVELARR